ncbi:hypothetical protein HDU83_005013 [Entophlyctis luteolus]|nr:hypothetical protein HDU83_005013 [Entophlyctis luteolus]
MASFVAPLVLCPRAHAGSLLGAARITAVAASAASARAAGVLVAALDSGEIATFSHSPPPPPHAAPDDPPPVVLAPRSLLLARRSHSSHARVVALLLCRLDIDSRASADNIVVSASEDGTIIMWDLADGRALQAVSGAFPGTPTCLLISSSARYIICAGLGDCFVILDASTLETVKTVKNSHGWSSSIAIYSTGPTTPDHIFRGTTSGTVDAYLFDETNLEFVRTGEISLQQNQQQRDFSAVISLHVSHFEPRYILAVKNRMCFVRIRMTALVGLEDASYLLERFYSSLSMDQHMLISLEIRDWSHIPKVVVDRKELASIEGQSMFSAIARFTPANIGEATAGSVLCFLPSENAPFNSNKLVYENVIPSRSPTDESLNSGGVISFGAGNEVDFSTELNKSFGDGDGIGITSATIISDKLMAIGCDSGKIYIIGITTPFLHSIRSIESHSLAVLNGHNGAVRALFQMDFRGSTSGGIRKNVLISGSSDRTIKIWDLETASLLGTIVCHSKCVRFFLPIPLNAGMKIHHGIISIAEDESLAFLDLDTMKSQFVLTGHTRSITSLHWRSQDEVLVVECSDKEKSVFVWQLKTSHLDRIETGEYGKDIVSCCDCHLMLNDFANDYSNSAMKQTFSVFPVLFGSRGNPAYFILLVNLKRLINDVYGGQYSLTPPSTPPSTRKPNVPRGRPETPTIKDAAFGIRLSPSRQHEGTSAVSPHRKRTATNVDPDADSGKESPTITSVVTAPSRVFSDANLLHGILSVLMSWGVDGEIDTVCRDTLELLEPLRGVRVGQRGASGFISVPIASAPASTWTMSGTATASRMLQIASLMRTIGAKSGHEKQTSLVISKLCDFMQPPDAGAGKHPFPRFEYPSFAYLVKYWQDQISDVQQAARTIFGRALRNLSDSDKKLVIDYWKDICESEDPEEVPSLNANSSKRPSKANVRATILLAIIGSEDPSLLLSRLCKDVAESLDILLKEDIRSPQRLIAVELVGRGFKTWEPHLNSSQVVRSLILTTGLQSPSTGSTANANAMSPAFSISGRAPPTSSMGDVPSQALVMVSRQAVVQIASINPALFISTVTFDFVHSKNISERIGGLKLLGMFIAKKPHLIYSFIPRIVESMVKSLDPNVSGMREAVQNIVTSNFAEIVKTFRNVAFHSGIQKLAVGTADGLTVVYDLKTATKGYVFEGHSKPITAVSFSPDGKLAVTFSYEENVVRFWQMASGFLNTLVGAFGGGGGSSGASMKAGHVKSFRDFSVGPVQGEFTLGHQSLSRAEPLVCYVHVRTGPNFAANFEGGFEWLSERSVRLHSVGETKLVFTV